MADFITQIKPYNMKTFGVLKYDDAVYSVTADGVVRKHIIHGIQDFQFAHEVKFTFTDGSISLKFNKDFKAYADDNDTMYFANTEDVLSYLNGLADTANEVIQNCLVSLKLFN
jgi:hypothetical protein